MDNPHNCCGCCSLKTGITVLGSFSLISSVSTTILGSIAVPTCYNNFSDYYDNYSDCVTQASVFIACGCLLFLFSSLLLYGVLKERPGYLMPYYCYACFSYCFALLFMLYCFIDGYVGSGVFFLVKAAVFMYFTYCVSAYRKFLIHRALVARDTVVLTPTVNTIYGLPPPMPGNTGYGGPPPPPGYGGHPPPYFAQPPPPYAATPTTYPPSGEFEKAPVPVDCSPPPYE